jgi:biopolymer transport protein ExbB
LASVFALTAAVIIADQVAIVLTQILPAHPAILGLAVGVLAHLAHHFLRGRVRALVRDMEWVANEIMRILLIEMPAVQKEGDDDGHPTA